VFVKVYVENPCTGVDSGPSHNDCLAVNAPTHNVERLARAADAIFVRAMTTISARSDDILVHELPDAHSPDNVPNRNNARSIDGECVYAVAE